MTQDLVAGLGCFCAVTAAGGLAYYVYQIMSSQSINSQETVEDPTGQMQLSQETTEKSNVSAFNLTPATQDSLSLEAESTEVEVYPSTSLQLDVVSSREEITDKANVQIKKTAFKKYFQSKKKKPKDHTVINVYPIDNFNKEILPLNEEMIELVADNATPIETLEMDDLFVNQESIKINLKDHPTTTTVQHSQSIKAETSKLTAIYTTTPVPNKDNSSKQQTEEQEKRARGHEIMVQVVDGQDAGRTPGGRTLSPSPHPWPHDLSKWDSEDITNKTFYYVGKIDHKLVAISEGTSTDSLNGNQNVPNT